MKEVFRTIFRNQARLFSPRKLCEKSKSAQTRLLHDVFGVLFVAHQKTRQTVRGIEYGMMRRSKSASWEDRVNPNMRRLFQS